MAEPETPGVTPALDTPTPESSAIETPEPEPTPDDPKELKAELDRARAALKKANGEAADRRKALAAFEREKKEQADAKLSEVERLKQADAERAAALETANQTLRRERVERTVEAVARELNFIDPDDALRPEVLDAAKVDEAGKVDRDSVKKALDKLVKAKAHLVKPTKPAPTNRIGGTPPAHHNSTPRPADDQQPTRRRSVL